MQGRVEVCIDFHLDPTKCPKELCMNQIIQKSKSKNKWYKNYKITVPILFLMPACLILIIFTIVPSLSALVLSFTKWDMMSNIEFIGIDNYRKLFKDITFLKSFKNTSLYVLGYVPIVVIFSLIIALLLNEKWFKGKNLFRVIFYLPYIISPVAISMIWKWVYNPAFGLLNQFIGLFGVHRQFWLEDSRFAIPALVLMTVWQMFGYNVVLFMAGLLSIPSSYYEAASVEGASKLQTIRFIILPLLAPTTIFVIVISIINSFQVFDQVLILGGVSGPPKSLEVVVYYLYKVSFSSFKMGYGATIGMVLFLSILIITIIQFNYYTRSFE